MYLGGSLVIVQTNCDHKCDEQKYRQKNIKVYHESLNIMLHQESICMLFQHRSSQTYSYQKSCRSHFDEAFFRMDLQI